MNNTLNTIFQREQSALIALSGGVDSMLLCVLAKEAGIAVHTATVISEFTPSAEIERAKKFANSLDIPWHGIEISLLEDEEICKNPPERCYLCKKIIMQEMINLAKSLNLASVFDGTHADDVAADNRPGIRALREAGIISPFAEAGVTKEEILLEAESRRIPTPPPSACLATRIPCGNILSKENLALVDFAETILRDCGVAGILRVRLDGGGAVVEAEPEALETAKLYEYKLKQIGIRDIAYRRYGKTPGA